jgi:hypothetical protein
MTDTPTQTAMPTPEHYGPDAHLPAEGPHELFIVPARSGTHFQANIGGRMLDLADPGSTDWVAPTPDDLFVASIASDFAWLARRFLISRGLDDYVSVSAAWRAHNGQPPLEQLEMTVIVSNGAEEACSPLVAVLQDRFAARSQSIPLRVCVQSS